MSKFQILTPEGEVDYQQPIKAMSVTTDIETECFVLALSLHDGRTVQVGIPQTFLEDHLYPF
jgi:hypothetical protein